MLGCWWAERVVVPVKQLPRSLFWMMLCMDDVDDVCTLLVCACACTYHLLMKARAQAAQRAVAGLP